VFSSRKFRGGGECEKKQKKIWGQGRWGDQVAMLPKKKRTKFGLMPKRPGEGKREIQAKKTESHTNFCRPKMATSQGQKG